MDERFRELCSEHFYEGLLLATVTDRDGVEVLKCKSENAKDDLMEPTLATTFAVTNNQASKLGLGNNQSMISVYDIYQIIQLIDTPLIINIVAEASANTELTKPLVETMLNERQST
ncbi:unnamed protein product [Rhizopus stolonifer]